MRNPTLRFISLVTTLAAVLAACVSGTSTIGDTRPPDRVGKVNDPNRPGGNLPRNLLVAFEACDPFLDYVIDRAVDMVGPYGLEDPFFYPLFGGDQRLDVFAMEESFAAPTADSAARAGVDYSGTNVQVLGVDEPDMVKTDGERIVVLSEGMLIVADITGSKPKVISRLQVGNMSVQSLFLSGDTVLLFGSTWGNVYPLMEADAEFGPVYPSPTWQIIEVDIRGDAEIVRTMSVDGQFVSARMVDDSVRVVLTSGPVGFEWSYPSGSGLSAERKATEENRDIIRDSTAENWIPYYLVTDADGDVTAEGILFDCERASHPEEFSGLNMLSIMTIDIANGLDVVDSTGILANGDTIYASAGSLYVATQDWNNWRWIQTGNESDRPQAVTTDIHKFDISDPQFTSYVATGRVDGYLLSQFAMDEHNGLLRVASTSQPTWWGSGLESESMVTLLEEDGGELVEIGYVDGLGKGEQIYSVRFMGDVAYVVTFRQTDPLYTIDLSDPRRPEVVGELKILGYSAYLHPIGNGLLMGIGQDATETGRLKGTQVSIFDVSDLAHPVRVDQHTLAEGSNSEIEYDHHAFLYWEATGLTMVPLQQWSWDGKSESAFFGAVGLTVDEDGELHEVRRIAHPGGDNDDWDWRAQIQRSIVIGDSVYTVSAKGIMKSDLDSLREEAWLRF